MNRQKCVVLICLLLLGAISACGQAATPEPAATPQPTATPEPTATPSLPGWEKFEGGGVELWLPESFEGGDLAKDVDVIAENLRRFAPDSEEMAQLIEQNPSMYVIWAFDSEVGDTGFLTNAAVTTEKVVSAITLDVYLDAAVQQFPDWLQVLERDIITLGDYQAGRLLVGFAISGIEGMEVMYAVKVDNDMWVLTFATGVDEFKERLLVFEQSALTFRPKP